MDVGQIQVGDVPTPIAGAGYTDSAAVTNIGHARVWIGESDVTPNSGTPLEPGETRGFPSIAGLHAVRMSTPRNDVAVPPYAAVSWIAQ